MLMPTPSNEATPHFYGVHPSVHAQLLLPSFLQRAEQQLLIKVETARGRPKWWRGPVGQGGEEKGSCCCPLPVKVWK